MNNLEKIEITLNEVSNKISNMNQNLNEDKKMIFVHDRLIDFAILLSSILIQNLNDKNLNFTDIFNKIDFQMTRLYEVSGINKENLKKYIKEK